MINSNFTKVEGKLLILQNLTNVFWTIKFARQKFN